jgi:hypothetical protein
MGGMPHLRRAGLALVLALSALPAAHAAPLPPASTGSGSALALARAVAPRAADFPFGWTATSGERGPGAACLVTPVRAAHAQAYQLSPKLAAAAVGSQATAIAAVYASVETAASALPLVVSANPVGCLHQLLVDTLSPSKITVKAFVSSRLPFPKIGDSVSATRYRAPIVRAGDSQSVYVDMVFVQRRNVVVGMALLGLGGKPAIADERAMLAKAVARISP